MELHNSVVISIETQPTHRNPQPTQYRNPQPAQPNVHPNQISWTCSIFLIPHLSQPKHHPIPPLPCTQRTIPLPNSTNHAILPPHSLDTTPPLTLHQRIILPHRHIRHKITEPFQAQWIPSPNLPHQCKNRWMWRILTHSLKSPRKLRRRPRLHRHRHESLTTLLP